MALDIEAIHSKGSFSFLDLLNSPTQLVPQNMNWVQEEEQEEANGQGNFTFLLRPPSPGYSVGMSDESPSDAEQLSRRNSSASSDTTNSSSLSMPDLQVWGIGDGNASQSSSIVEMRKESLISRPRSSSYVKPVERGNEKYRIRRERNNISVRKSRAKTKSKIGKIEEQVGRFEQENKHLKLKLVKVRKFLNEFESSFLTWRNILREMEEELSSTLNLT